MQTLTRLILIAVAGVLIGCGPTHVRKPTVPLEPSQILDRMTAAYAKLASYEDQGEVIQHWPSGPRTLQFTTSFERKNKNLRFDFVSHHPSKRLFHIKTYQALVSAMGRTVVGVKRTVNADYNWRAERNLGYGIAALAGVSATASFMVPTLLVTFGKRVKWPARLKKLTLLPHADWEGTRCLRIRASGRVGMHQVLWIGAQDLLLRRIVTTRDGRRSEQNRRNIRVGQAIAMARFKLPPTSDVTAPIVTPTLTKAQVTAVLHRLRSAKTGGDRMVAASRLALVADARVIPALLAALADKYHLVRSMAVGMLSRQLRKHPNHELRKKATEQLRELAKNDPSPRVRGSAGRAVQRLEATSTKTTSTSKPTSPPKASTPKTTSTSKPTSP